MDYMDKDGNRIYIEGPRPYGRFPYIIWREYRSQLLNESYRMIGRARCSDDARERLEKMAARYGWREYKPVTLPPWELTGSTVGDDGSRLDCYRAQGYDDIRRLVFVDTGGNVTHERYALNNRHYTGKARFEYDCARKHPELRK
jgi:hypothetical protein